MKKGLLLLLSVMTIILINGCNQEIPDYSVDEAFVMMNDAIDEYLNADSISIDYFGSYDGANYQNSEEMNIRMRHMNSEDLIGRVKMDITENENSFLSRVDFLDGIVYTSKTLDGTTDYVKAAQTHSEYQTLYQSFLKSTVEYSKTRYVQILIDKKTLTVNFEIHQDQVESTFFVSNVLQSVGFATCSFMLDHHSRLLHFIISYGGIINSIQGTETFRVNILKLNQYVIIDQLSKSEKAMYQEASTDES